MITDEYRVGKRHGQNRWQIKQAPGWRVAHECDTLEEAAAWLKSQGVNIDSVSVLTACCPWKTLAEHVGDNAAAFADFWHAKWPHQTRDVKKLEMSAHYVGCREAFYAGAQAANAAGQTPAAITGDDDGTL